MTTTAQIEANQQNALLSTGPRGEEGKRVASENAVTHGVASRDPKRYLESAGAETLARWRGDFPVRRSDHHQLVETAAASEERLRLCRKQFTYLIAFLMFRARNRWDDDRRAEVVEIAAGLARNPAKTVAKLSGSRHGVEWLIVRWTDFMRRFKDAGSLSESLRNRVEELLGIEKDLRNGFYSDAELLTKAASAIEGLRLALTTLTQLDAMRREAATEGVVDENNPDLRLIRRYEREAMRDHTRAVAELQRLFPGRGGSLIYARAMERMVSGEFGFVSSNPPEPSPTPPAPPPPPAEQPVFATRAVLDDELDDLDDLDDEDQPTATEPKKPLTGRQRRHLAKMMRERKKMAARQGKPRVQATSNC